MLGRLCLCEIVFCDGKEVLRIAEVTWPDLMLYSLVWEPKILPILGATTQLLEVLLLISSCSLFC